MIIHENMPEQIVVGKMKQYKDDREFREHYHELSQEAQAACKNAHMWIEEYMEDGFPKYRRVHDKNTCQNARRNGSAYCQECSDKHNQ